MEKLMEKLSFPFMRHNEYLIRIQFAYDA
jgi:hypothetical protein